jgi:hypothetical protein
MNRSGPNPFEEIENRRARAWEQFLTEHPDALDGSSQQQQTAELPTPQPECAVQPEFPSAAWRPLFAEYRTRMERATEASDAFHFAALWAQCAVALGRRVHFPYGMQLFPNVYLVCFGPTGDRKTTATRKGTELGSLKVIHGGGSGEGLADEFSSAKPGSGLLVYAEEFSQILRPGKWEGSTLKPFLTQCFDCPQRYEMKFRKSPVKLEQPTPSLLAGTTPDWFWQDCRPGDFQGGFANRLFFFTGARKPPLPLPESPKLDAISEGVDSLRTIQPCEAHFEPKARMLWESFYGAWQGQDSRREPLLLAAVQRVPAYILKLAMLYAATESTLPEITCDQLSAAILVGTYGEACSAELLALQNAGTSPRKELERRILAYVSTQQYVTKREIYRALSRHYRDTEDFNRAFDSLLRAGQLFTREAERKSVQVSIEPFSNAWR